MKTMVGVLLAAALLLATLGASPVSAVDEQQQPDEQESSQYTNYCAVLPDNIEKGAGYVPCWWANSILA